MTWNIARGTTDPGYRVYNLNYLFDCIELVFIQAPEMTLVTARRSDNIDASGLPNTSFESLCPKLFREHVENVGTFEIGGPSPLQSQLIQIRALPKELF